MTILPIARNVKDKIIYLKEMIGWRIQKHTQNPMSITVNSAIISSLCKTLYQECSTYKFHS
jgi:hypothetical protein